jgi:hypothetical protein
MKYTSLALLSLEVSLGVRIPISKILWDKQHPSQGHLAIVHPTTFPHIFSPRELEETKISSSAWVVGCNGLFLPYEFL